MVLVNYGPDEGKLAVILDVADNNKVGASCVVFVGEGKRERKSTPPRFVTS